MAWIALIANRLKGLVVVILGLIRRSLCCFRRRRRSSCEPTPLMTVGVVSNFESEKPGPDLVNWNSWEDPSGVVTERSPSTVQQHIERYRQQTARALSEQPCDEPQPDFFENMTPRITKQKKILIKTHEQSDELPSRLAFTPDGTLPMDTGEELGSWEEREGVVGSWEEAENWDTNQMVREQRRAERERRVAEQSKRREAGSMRHTLGARLS